MRELVDAATASLTAANQAREVGLVACRKVIRASGSAIRSVHRLDFDEATTFIVEAERALREAQDVLEPHPAVAYAGFLTDAEKEFVEAKLTLAFVQGTALPSAADLVVMPASWLKGLAEATSEMRRHLLDRLRADDLERGGELLTLMDDVYDALITVDFPDAITGGLRRTLDALRAVLERTRGDVTTTVLQTRLREAIESSLPSE
ncbi:MAG: translin [Acidimicrobiaceae bacterium]